MNNIDERVFYLFNLYYKKQASRKELNELFELLDQLNDEQLTHLMQSTWDDVNTGDVLFEPAKSKAILSNILSAASTADNVIFIKPKSFLDWKKIAAVIFISLSIGAYFIKRKTDPDKNTIAQTQLMHDALPGNNKAILILSSGARVVLDNTSAGVVAKQGNALVTKSKDGEISYKEASAIADDNVIAFNTIATPKGGQYQVVLPDGSKVWLNAASSIRFPTAFTGAERHVEITGEAYFEVAKNPAMPFIVKVNREEVRVLGTHFNIMAYTDEHVLNTTLLEGSIRLTSGKSVHILKPGNQAVLNEQGQMRVIQDADVDGAVAWKNGLFQFDEEDIQSIMRQAARWYDVDISYRGKMSTRRFTGKIPRNVKLSELLSIFKYAGLNFDIEGKNITVIN